jgi:hypothetical protein
MPRNKRPKYNLTSSQRRMLRQDPTLHFYTVEASAEPGGAPVCIKHDNPYHGAAAAIADGAAHGAAAAIADGAAHASTSHGSTAGQQPDVAVSADGHTVLPTAHGPDDHEQHLAVSDAEDIAQSAAEQNSPGCVYSAHSPELPDAVRLDAAAGGSVRPVVDTEITQYIEAMRAYFRADQPPMLRVSQALPFRAAVYAMPTEWDAHASRIKWRRHCITGVARVATLDGPASFVYFCNCCTDSQVGLRLVQMFHDKPESTCGLQSARCLHARALQHMLGPDASGPNKAVESSREAGLITADCVLCEPMWAVHCVMIPSARHAPSHPDPSHPLSKNGMVPCWDVVRWCSGGGGVLGAWAHVYLVRAGFLHLWRDVESSGGRHIPDVVSVGTVHQFRNSTGDPLYQVGLFGECGGEVGLVYGGRCRCCQGQRCLHSRTVDRLPDLSDAPVHDDDLGEQVELELPVDQQSHGSREAPMHMAPSAGSPGPRRSLRSAIVRATVLPDTRQWLTCTLEALRNTCHVMYMHTTGSSLAVDGRCSWDGCISRVLTFLNNIPGASQPGVCDVLYTFTRAERGVSNMNAGCNNWCDRNLSARIVDVISAPREGFLCSAACKHAGALEYVLGVGPLQGSILRTAVTRSFPGLGVDVIMSRGMSYTPPHQDSHATVLVLASLSSKDAVMRVAVRGNAATDLRDDYNPFRCCERRCRAVCSRCWCWEIFELREQGSCVTLPAGVVHAVESHGFRVAVSYWI